MFAATPHSAPSTASAVVCRALLVRLEGDRVAGDRGQPGSTGWTMGRIIGRGAVAVISGHGFTGPCLNSGKGKDADVTAEYRWTPAFQEYPGGDVDRGTG